MARSHPPTLLTTLSATLRRGCSVQRGDHILVAVSGGGDSQSLLHALARLAPKLGLVLSAHGVDHGLRPEASAELDMAQELAGDLGVAFGRSQLSVRPGANLMHRARRARYQALRQAAADVGAGLIATAHHADDRAETVLLRLLRGAGPEIAGGQPLPPILPTQLASRLQGLVGVGQESGGYGSKFRIQAIIGNGAIGGEGFNQKGVG